MKRTFNEYLIDVFIKVFVGLAITLASAAVVYIRGWYQITSLIYTALILELILAFIFAFTLRVIDKVVAYILYIAYCVLSGVAFSIYPVIYDGGSILLAIGLTTFMFLLLAAYGLITKKSLSSWQPYLFIGLIGIIIALIINIFLRNDFMDFVITCISIVIFLGYTAYDTHKIRAYYYEESNDENSNLSIYGAFQLYLDFINLFIDILKLLARIKSSDD